MFRTGYVGRQIVGGGSGNPLFASASLDLNFAGGVLDPRLTFTRAAGPATYYDATGTLQLASFNSIRNNSGAGAVAGTPGTDPTEWTSANALGLTRTIATGTEGSMSYVQYRFNSANATNGNLNIILTPNTTASLPSTASTAYVFSSYISFVAGAFPGVGMTLRSNQFDSGGTSTGPVTSTTFSYSAMNIGDPLARTRLAFTFTSVGTTAFLQPFIQIPIPPGPIDFTVRIGLPQLELGATPTTAIPTSGVATGAPRFDNDPVTLAPRGLLIEETRTNILTNNSQAINSWPTKIDSTVTDNNVASPDGTINASSIVTGVAGSDAVGSSLMTVAAGSTLTWSCYAKRGNFDWLHVFGLDTASANGVQTWVNLATGAFNTGTIIGAATNPSANVVPLSNGWWRVILMVTMPGTSTTAQIQARTAVASGSGSRVNNGQYYLWGGQIEVGAFPTSYIPTVAAAATRPGDVCTMPVGAWYNATTSTIAVSFMVPFSTLGAGNSNVSAELDDGTTLNAYTTRCVGPGSALQTIAFSANVTAGSLSAATGFASYTAMKQASTFNSSALTMTTSANASSVGSIGISAAPLNINRLAIGGGRGLSLDGWISRVSYWPTVLSNAQLQSITT